MYSVLDPGYFTAGEITEEPRKYRGYRIDVNSTNTVLNLTADMGAYSYKYDFIM